jgi:hypothetical protein
MFKAELLYTPHPLEDEVSLSDVEHWVQTIESCDITSPASYMRKTAAARLLERAGLTDPFVPNNPMYNALNTRHINYIEHASVGLRDVRPDHEAALIVRKFAALIDNWDLYDTR